MSILFVSLLKCPHCAVISKSVQSVLEASKSVSQTPGCIFEIRVVGEFRHGTVGRQEAWKMRSDAAHSVGDDVVCGHRECVAQFAQGVHLRVRVVGHYLSPQCTVVTLNAFGKVVPHAVESSPSHIIDWIEDKRQVLADILDLCNGCCERGIGSITHQVSKLQLVHFSHRLAQYRFSLGVLTVFAIVLARTRTTHEEVVGI